MPLLSLPPEYLAILALLFGTALVLSPLAFRRTGGGRSPAEDAPASGLRARRAPPGASDRAERTLRAIECFR